METIIHKISKIIPKFNHTVFTLDFHPFSYCSFSILGGRWLMHCIQYSFGVSIPLSLIAKAGTNRSFYRKGMCSGIEEYGAFGIAGDYCVLKTIKNLLKLVPKERVFVFLEVL